MNDDTFSTVFALTGNAAEAARMAGSKAKTPKAQSNVGRKKLENAGIKAAVSEKKAALADKFEVTAENLLATLAEVRARGLQSDEGYNAGAVIKACGLMAQIAGLLVTKQEVKLTDSFGDRLAELEAEVAEGS